MTASIHSSTHQFTAPDLDCSWVLPPMGACTLSAPAGGVLHVRGGRVWATFDGPHAGPANDWGDRVLQAGERLALRSGEQLVLEVYGDASGSAASLCWEPALQTTAKPAGSGWRRHLAALGRLASGRGTRALAWAHRLG